MQQADRIFPLHCIAQKSSRPARNAWNDRRDTGKPCTAPAGLTGGCFKGHAAAICNGSAFTQDRQHTPAISSVGENFV
jgi:hypothetical protein